MAHDPGGKALFPLQPGITGNAYITPDEQHRLWLSRTWGPGARYLAILGMNPSTARPDMDDPTIRRDIGFAQRLGFDGLFKINYATYRATDPKKLRTLGAACVHPENVHILRKIGGRCFMVIIATGVVEPALRSYARSAIDTLREVKSELWCFGFTKDGYPKHTLYLKSDTKPVRFP